MFCALCRREAPLATKDDERELTRDVARERDERNRRFVDSFAVTGTVTEKTKFTSLFFFLKQCNGNLEKFGSGTIVLSNTL